MRHHHPGNLYIQFEVQFPTSIPGLNLGDLNVLKKITGLKHETPKGNNKKDQNDDNEPEEDDEKAEAGKQEKINGDVEMNDTPPLPEEVDIYTEPLFYQEDPKEKGKFLPLHKEDHYLEEVDQSGGQRANGVTMEDDEDDGVPSGGERVQCASQ